MTHFKSNMRAQNAPLYEADMTTGFKNRETRSLPLNKIIYNDCVEAMNALTAGSVDLIFADPP